MTERNEGIGMQFLSLWSPSDPSLWHKLFCLIVIAVTSHRVVVVVVHSCSIRNLNINRFCCQVEKSSLHRSPCSVESRVHFLILVILAMLNPAPFLPSLYFVFALQSPDLFNPQGKCAQPQVCANIYCIRLDKGQEG